MNVTLTPQLEEFVRKQVEKGAYDTPSAVVQDALRLLDERDRAARLQAALASGDEQYRRGAVTEWTSTSLDELIAEADDEDRLGIPIRDDVQPAS